MAKERELIQIKHLKVTIANHIIARADLSCTLQKALDRFDQDTASFLTEALVS